MREDAHSDFGVVADIFIVVSTVSHVCMCVCVRVCVCVGVWVCVCVWVC